MSREVAIGDLPLDELNGAARETDLSFTHVYYDSRNRLLAARENNATIEFILRGETYPFSCGNEATMKVFIGAIDEFARIDGVGPQRIVCDSGAIWYYTNRILKLWFDGHLRASIGMISMDGDAITLEEFVNGTDVEQVLS